MKTAVKIEKPEFLTYLTMIPHDPALGIPDYVLEMEAERSINQACVAWWPDTLQVLKRQIRGDHWDEFVYDSMSVGFIGIKRALPPECTCDCHMSKWVTESSGEDFLDGVALPL